MEEERRKIFKQVYSTLLSSKLALTVNQLNKDYELLMGEYIPYKKLGFSSIQAFFQAHPDLEVGQDGCVRAKTTGRSMHIAEMVSHQKKSKTKKKHGSARPTGSSWLRPRQNGYGFPTYSRPTGNSWIRPTPVVHGLQTYSRPPPPMKPQQTRIVDTPKTSETARLPPTPSNPTRPPLAQIVPPQNTASASTISKNNINPVTISAVKRSVTRSMTNSFSPPVNPSQCGKVLGTIQRELTSSPSSRSVVIPQAIRTTNCPNLIVRPSVVRPPVVRPPVVRPPIFGFGNGLSVNRNNDVAVSPWFVNNDSGMQVFEYTRQSFLNQQQQQPRQQKPIIRSNHVRPSFPITNKRRPFRRSNPTNVLAGRLAAIGKQNIPNENIVEKVESLDMSDSETEESSEPEQNNPVTFEHPLEELKKLANSHKLSITTKVSVMQWQKSGKYLCSITVGLHSFSSYPDLADSIETAENICASKALEGLIPKFNNTLNSPKKSTYVPQKDNFMHAYASSIISPNSFFLRRADHQAKLSALQDQLQARYQGVTSGDVKLKDVVTNSIYACYKEGTWYRICIKKIMSKIAISVFYCDFGYYQSVRLHQLVPLDQAFRRLPFQAMKARLVGVLPRNNFWSVPDCDRFKEMIQDQLLFVLVEGVEPDTIYPEDSVLQVILGIKTKDMGDILVRDELAKMEVAVKNE